MLSSSHRLLRVSISRNANPQQHLYLHVYDDEGHHIGLNYGKNQTKTEIPLGKYYDNLNGTIVIFLPTNATDFRVEIDAKYAKEESESYNLTIIVMDNEQVMSQKEIQSTIKKGSTKEYQVEISENGEISLIEEAPTPFPWWILGAVAVVMVGVGATLVIWKRKKTKSLESGQTVCMSILYFN